MDVTPAHRRHSWLTAHHTSLGWGEILNLTWDHVDFEVGVSCLRPEGTKARAVRPIPLTKELFDTLRTATIYLDESGRRVPYVFIDAGQKDRLCATYGCGPLPHHGTRRAQGNGDLQVL
jgi:integrase